MTYDWDITKWLPSQDEHMMNALDIGCVKKTYHMIRNGDNIVGVIQPDGSTLTSGRTLFSLRDRRSESYHAPVNEDKLSTGHYEAQYDYVNRLHDLRTRVRARLEERRNLPSAPPLSPAPRYDDVFFSGVAWLDGQAHKDEEAELNVLSLLKVPTLDYS